MLVEDEEIFFSGPLPPNDGWVENVVPSLSALAAKPTWQVLGDDHPVLGAILLDFGFQDLILRGCPLAADEDMCGNFFFIWIQWRQKLRNNSSRLRPIQLLELEPSLEAANLSLIRHKFAKSMPRVFAVELDKISQFDILYWYLIYFRIYMDLQRNY